MNLSWILEEAKSLMVMDLLVFGQVTEGMEIVKKIQEGENEQQMLLKPITINSIRIID